MASPTKRWGLSSTYQYFDYPGRYKQDPNGKAFAQHRLDGLRNVAVAGSGQSNSAVLSPGHTFTLTEHRNSALNIVWQIVVVPSRWGWRKSESPPVP